MMFIMIVIVVAAITALGGLLSESKEQLFGFIFAGAVIDVAAFIFIYGIPG
jgi:hypothetical protein